MEENQESKEWLAEGGTLIESRQKDLNDGPVFLRDNRRRNSGFLSARRLLEECWPENWNSTDRLHDVKNFITKLEKIPYMKDCLQENLAKARL
jgi:hypothetical protein